MGEIIIKVPEDVREVIDLGLPYKEVKDMLEKIIKKKDPKKALRFLIENAGRLQEGDLPTEEEVYMQGD